MSSAAAGARSMPSIIRRAFIISSTTNLLTCAPTIKSTISCGSWPLVITYARNVEQPIMNVIAAVSLTDSPIVLTNSLAESLLMNHTTITYNVVIPADSVTVNIPKQIPPTIIKGITSAGIAVMVDLHICATLHFSCTGNWRFLAVRTTTKIYRIADSMPGITPDMKSHPIDSPDWHAYRTSNMLGGMIGPREPAAAITAPEKPPPYPSFFIAGINIAPNDAIEAAEDPQIAAKKAPAATPAIANPPLNLPKIELQKSIST